MMGLLGWVMAASHSKVTGEDCPPPTFSHCLITPELVLGSQVKIEKRKQFYTQSAVCLWNLLPENVAVATSLDG